jgi:hypothetical protein
MFHLSISDPVGSFDEIGMDVMPLWLYISISQYPRVSRRRNEVARLKWHENLTL